MSDHQPITGTPDTVSVEISDAKKLALLLIGVLSNMRMKRDPNTGNYVYTQTDPVVLTDQSHDIMHELLQRHGDFDS